MELRINVNTAVVDALLGRLPPEAQRALDRAMESSRLLLTAEVKKRTPQGVSGAQGGLLASIDSRVEGKGTAFIKGIVFSNHPYAEVIEKGRKPGKGVPKGVLIPWITAKLGITDPEEIERVEYLIRWKIYQKGFEGRHMFEEAFEANYGRIQAIFQRAGIEIERAANGS